MKVFPTMKFIVERLYHAEVSIASNKHKLGKYLIQNMDPKKITSVRDIMIQSSRNESPMVGGYKIHRSKTSKNT